MVIWITTKVLYDSSLVSESWNGNPNHRRSLIMGSGMKWIRVLALSLSLWGWGDGVAIAAQPSLGSSFRQWCLQRSSLPAETRKTVVISYQSEEA
jgi:hypothetical protein